MKTVKNYYWTESKAQEIANKAMNAGYSACVGYEERTGQNANWCWFVIVKG